MVISLDVTLTCLKKEVILNRISAKVVGLLRWMHYTYHWDITESLRTEPLGWQGSHEGVDLPFPGEPCWASDAWAAGRPRYIAGWHGGKFLCARGGVSLDKSGYRPVGGSVRVYPCHNRYNGKEILEGRAAPASSGSVSVITYGRDVAAHSLDHNKGHRQRVEYSSLGDGTECGRAPIPKFYGAHLDIIIVFGISSVLLSVSG